MFVHFHHLLCLCKDKLLNLLGHHILWKCLQLASQKLDGSLPHDVLPLQDLGKEASQSAWISTNRRKTQRLHLDGQRNPSPATRGKTLSCRTQHLPLASILKMEMRAAVTWLNSAESSEEQPEETG